MPNFRPRALELIQGGYDLHIHTIPSHFERVQDDFELVQAAQKVGMAGVMLKSHYDPTAARAALVNRHTEGTTRAFGGVVLNWPVGGLNPYAVESCLKLGGAVVWLPTRDASNCLQFGDMPGDFFSRPGIEVFTPEGALVPQIFEIMEIVRKYDAVLATGHVSTEEAVSVCKAGREMGIRMIYTHPEWCRTAATKEVQAEMADLGVAIEKNWMNVADGICTAEDMVENIRFVGPERVFLATDRGQADREEPIEGMLRFIELLLEQGFSDQEIKRMVRDVPGALVAGK